MTYKELEREIQNLNAVYGKQLKVCNNDLFIEVRDGSRFYAIISNTATNCMQTWEESFLSLDENLRHDLLRVVYEFTQTPTDSRNLYPKFYISSKLTFDYAKSFLFKFDGDIDS